MAQDQHLPGPTHKGTTAAKQAIDKSTDRARDELLTDMLCIAYPLRVSQDN